MSVVKEGLRRALAGEHLPCVVVDLGAFDRNLDRHLALLGGTPLRIASKSLRVVGLIERLLARGGGRMRGVMCFTAGEAVALAGRGLDDLLVAYPTVDARDLAAVAAAVAGGKRLSLAVDSTEGVDLVARAGKIPVVICLDMAFEVLGLHLGVRRSPVRTPEQALALARHIQRAGLPLDGLLAYEAQVAGLGDEHLRPLFKRASMRDVAGRRTAIARALRDAGFDLRVVNGGGVGSLDVTTPATGVNEVTAGSGFYKPHLFDRYRAAHVRALEPSCFFVLPVVRRPAPGFVTCLGGGYAASGSAGRDRLPQPEPGLLLLDAEGAGEVQTPLAGSAADRLRLGDPVFFRHAKAGEIMERFNEVLLVEGERVIERMPTYRGEGWAFL